MKDYRAFCLLPAPPAALAALQSIRALDEYLLHLASCELRASRNHLPGQYPERYAQVRAEAREIAKLRDDAWMLIHAVVTPAYVVNP